MAASKRIIVYYQTFEGGIEAILQPEPICTHIHLSSVHFGTDPDGNLYIHLNDWNPNDARLDKVWHDMNAADRLGIRVVLMIGGAGGGWSTFFDNYEVCYGLLKDCLEAHPYISGINLDIEQAESLDLCIDFIERIRADFGPEFEISLAPVQFSLESDQPGMGGWCYKELWDRIGPEIAYFNGQFYSDYSLNAFRNCVTNGYPPDRIVMGMLAPADYSEVVADVLAEYPDMGGVNVWEFFNANPNGPEWVIQMGQILHKVPTNGWLDGWMGGWDWLWPA